MAKTISEQLACEAKGLTFRELPPEVVRQVKRCVLDTVGVGFAGYVSEPSQIIQRLIKELKEPAESTVFGSGLKTSCLYATLANGVMVRCRNYMDRTFPTKEATIQTGHNSESIPPILAVGERQHSSGQEVVTTIALAYQLLIKVSDSHGGIDGVTHRGWCSEAIRAPCVMGLMSGRLLGLNEEQMANALAIAGCFTLPLGILVSPKEEMTMSRDLKFPSGAYSGILGALLAQKGFKGPLNVFEGHHGINEVVAAGAMSLEKLTQPTTDWTILYTWIKRYAANGCMQGHLDATVTLVKEHDIKAEDVAEVRIKTSSHIYESIGADPASRRYPKDQYTADHSSYYTTAVAILDRAVGPEQWSDEKLRDPRVRELFDKIFIEEDPRLKEEEFNSPAVVEITTNKGQKYSCEVLRPKGHPMNPMTDDDIAEKFLTTLAGAEFVAGKNPLKLLANSIL